MIHASGDSNLEFAQFSYFAYNAIRSMNIHIQKDQNYTRIIRIANGIEAL